MSSPRRCSPGSIIWCLPRLPAVATRLPWGMPMPRRRRQRRLLRCYFRMPERNLVGSQLTKCPKSTSSRLPTIAVYKPWLHTACCANSPPPLPSPVRQQFGANVDSTAQCPWLQPICSGLTQEDHEGCLWGMGNISDVFRSGGRVLVFNVGRRCW